MEKNITGKNPSPDRDDMELKRHLDAAFEMDNLIVSEDLIQRTLSKIREAETCDTDNASENIRKKKRFPVKRFAGAAAAVFILATAVWAYQNNMDRGKKDSGSFTVEDKSIGIQSIESTNASQIADAGAAGGTSADENGNAKSKTGEDTTGNAARVPGTAEKKELQYGLTKEAPDSSEGLPSLKGTGFSITESTVDKDDIQSFTLLKQEGNKQQMNIDKATELYDLLGSYTIQTTDGKPSGKYLYCFIVTSKEDKTVTYEFFEDNTLNITDGRTENGTVTYTIAQGEELLSKLEDFIKE